MVLLYRETLPLSTPRRGAEPAQPIACGGGVPPLAFALRAFLLRMVLSECERPALTPPYWPSRKGWSIFHMPHRGIFHIWRSQIFHIGTQSQYFIAIASLIFSPPKRKCRRKQKKSCNRQRGHPAIHRPIDHQKSQDMPARGRRTGVAICRKKSKNAQASSSR